MTHALAFTVPPASRQPIHDAIPAAWIDGEGSLLAVRSASGRTKTVSAALLWIECRSAAGRRRRMADVEPQPAADIKIVRVEPIGRYGVNIAFSDGHDRGIYPWSFLEELAARPTVADFIID